jgi:hypothetical protein
MTYTSKAAMQRDVEALNREYSKLSDGPDNAVYSDMWDALEGVEDYAERSKIVDRMSKVRFPRELHNVNAKRLDRIEAAGYLAPELRVELERLKARLVEVKATPIVKPAPRGPAKPPVSDLGICQICGRAIRTPKGRIAEHGYRRMDWGFNVNSCFGSHAQSFEVSRQALGQWIQLIRDRIETLGEMAAETSRERLKISREISMLEMELKHQVERHDNWTPKTEAA